MILNLDTVKDFIECGGDVNGTNIHNLTPLIAASITAIDNSPNSIKLVSMLLDHGANISQKDKQRMNALMHASLRGNKGAVELLLQTCKKMKEINLENFLYQRDRCGNSAIALAAERGFLVVVELLLEAGAGAAIDHRNNCGNSPIALAAKGGFAVVVELLLEAGAAIDQSNNCGNSALALAAKGGVPVVVELLLEAGAAIDQPNNCGNSPIALAAKGGFPVVVELLLEAGAAIDQPNNSRQTPLFQAVEQLHFATVQLLVGAGADLETQDAHCNTLFSIAKKDTVLDTYLEEMKEIPKFYHLAMRWGEHRYLVCLRKADTSEIQSLLTNLPDVKQSMLTNLTQVKQCLVSLQSSHSSQDLHGLHSLHNILTAHFGLICEASSLLQKALAYEEQHQQLHIYDPLYISTIAYVRTHILKKLLYHVDNSIIHGILRFLPVRRAGLLFGIAGVSRWPDTCWEKPVGRSLRSLLGEA